MPPSKRAIICVSNDLSTDNRVHRSCDALVRNGFQVLAIGRKLPGGMDVQIPDTSISRMSLMWNRGFMFYASLNMRLFFKLLFRKADLIWCNDMDTLPACYRAAGWKGVKLIFDSHELFSEVPELVNRPKVKRFWRRLEDKYILKLKHCLTVSEGVAQTYKERYGADFKVIRNVPQRVEASTEQHGNYLIYQGVLNLGRGIELMIKSLHHHSYGLVVCGSGDIEDQLQELTRSEGLQDRVTFEGRLPRKLLIQKTMKAVLGMSLEEDLGLNYRFALPNKVFDYVQARIPSIVSDLPDMSDLIERHRVGEVLKERTPEALAALIRKVASASYSVELETAAQKLNWENESKKLDGLLQDWLI